MIIIAGAIIISLNNSNVITEAKNAIFQNNLAEEKQAIQIIINEWLLENKVETSPRTFKQFVKDEFKDATVISGTDNGPLTIQMNETGNNYNITSDGKITPSYSVVTEGNIEQYLFGKDLSGIKLYELLENAYNENGEIIGILFKDSNATTINEAEVYECIRCGAYEQGKYDLYFSDKSDINNIVTYRAKLVSKDNPETGETEYITDAVAGLEKIFEYNPNETRLGKVVSYDNKLWTIIYDDNVNGLQMICNEPRLHPDEELGIEEDYLRIGTMISTLPNWQMSGYIGLGINGGMSGTELAASSYYHAVEMLNAACESIVTPNTYIIDVRSAGSNPADKTIEPNIHYTSDKLAIWPLNQETTSQANNILKKTDTNYIADYNRIMGVGVFGINKYPNLSADEEIWLASRIIEEKENEVVFSIRSMNLKGYMLSKEIFGVTETNMQGHAARNYILPVVSLYRLVNFIGEGTVDNPYTF